MIPIDRPAPPGPPAPSRARRALALLLAAALTLGGAAGWTAPAAAQSGPVPTEPPQGPELLEVDAYALAEALVMAIADEIRRTWDVLCDAANFNIYDSEDAHKIKITVSNSGDCPFVMTITKVTATGTVTENFTIQPGTPSTINRSNVTKITIDCDGAAPNRCKASYTLIES